MEGPPLPTGRHRIRGMGQANRVGALQSPRPVAMGPGVTPYAPAPRGWGALVCLSGENDYQYRSQAKAKARRP